MLTFYSDFYMPYKGLAIELMKLLVDVPKNEEE